MWKVVRRLVTVVRTRVSVLASYRCEYQVFFDSHAVTYVAGSSDVYGYVSLNDIGESSLEKLGWFRWDKGQWDIRRGAAKLRQAHVR